MTGRLVLLSTTPRVAPGLLTWQAWEALRSADEVYAASPDHPLAAALADADVLLRQPTAAGSPHGATSTAALLLERAEGADVVWVGAGDGDPGLVDALTAAVAERASTADGAAALPTIQVVPGAFDLPGSRLLDLVAVMDRLRSPGGCPWDARQTHETLLPYLLEEAYETVEAIETGDDTALREELGDLLLQVVFHARLAQEAAAPWSVDDVATGIVTKLVSRHPHVFAAPAGSAGLTADQVEATWEELKQVEKRRSSVLDGVPLAQPALALAAKLMSRAERADLVVPLTEGASTPAELVGEELMALVARARAASVDPEAALRAAARRYAERARHAESVRGSAPTRHDGTSR